MGSVSEKRWFALEALEPRVMMSADPLLAAGAVNAAAPSPSAIEERILPDTNETGIASDPATHVADIFAGAAQEDLVIAPLDEKANANADDKSQAASDNTTAQVAQSQTVDSGSPSTSPATQSNPSIGSIAENVPSFAEQLTETLKAANGPPPTASQVTLSAQAPILPGLQWTGGAVESLAGQVFFLDFDGASNVTYHGPVVVEGINVPAFNLSVSGLGGQENTVLNSVVAALNERFSGIGVRFTAIRPQALSKFSIIYIGGTGSEFAPYGTFTGIAEEVDAGNRNGSDNAFVFPDLFNVVSLEDSVRILARSIEHEAGHLLGYTHIPPIRGAETSLQAVAMTTAVPITATPIEGTNSHPAEIPIDPLIGPTKSGPAPADPNGAPGPTHFVTVVNENETRNVGVEIKLFGVGAISWSLKNGGEKHFETLRAFFSNISGLYPEFVDPRVIYDQQAGRFVVSVLNLEYGTISDPSDPTNPAKNGRVLLHSKICLAVSIGADPEKGWYKKAFSSDVQLRIDGTLGIGGTPDPSLKQYFPDQPVIAVDEEAIYITGDMGLINSTSRLVERPYLWIVDKGLLPGAGFYEGGALVAVGHDPRVTILTVLPSQVKTLRPAHVYGSGAMSSLDDGTASPVGTFLVGSVDNNYGVGDRRTTLEIIQIENPLAANPTFRLTSFELQGQVAWESNTGAVQQGMPLTPLTLDTNLGKITQAVWRGDALWVTVVKIPLKASGSGAQTVAGNPSVMLGISAVANTRPGDTLRLIGRTDGHTADGTPGGDFFSILSVNSVAGTVQVLEIPSLSSGGTGVDWEIGGQDTVKWIRVNTSLSTNNTQTGWIDGEDISADAFTFYPSIAVDEYGNAGIGFSASGLLLFPGAYFVGLMKNSDGSFTPTPSVVVAEGKDLYFDTAGKVSGSNRWGDYSAVALDPLNGSFWVYNMYAQFRGAANDGTKFGKWGTKWASFSLGGAIGDRIFLDANRDGLFQEASELGVGGVEVRLWKNDGDPIREPGTGLTDDKLFATTHTNPEGFYLFANLGEAGQYFVQVVRETGYDFTLANVAMQAGTTQNSAVEEIMVGTTEHYVTRFVTPGNALERTLDAGLVADVMGVVFRDKNGDSIWNAGEPVVKKGMLVKLYRDDGDGLYNPGVGPTFDNSVGETKTDEAGRYVFFAEGQSFLTKPSTASPLPAGNYFVEFRAPFLNSFASANVPANQGGTEEIDSDVIFTDGQNGGTAMFPLGPPWLPPVPETLNAGVRNPQEIIWQNIKSISSSISSSFSKVIDAINGNSAVNKVLEVLKKIDSFPLSLINFLKTSPGPDLADLLGLDIAFKQHLDVVLAAGDEPTEDSLAEAMRDYAVMLLGTFVQGNLPDGESVTVTGDFDVASGELRFAVKMDATKPLHYELNLDALGGLTASAAIPVNVDATFKLDFVFGFSLSAYLADPVADPLTTGEVFWRINTFDVAADVSVPDVDAAVNWGFLGAAIQDGTFVLHAGAAMGVTDLTPGNLTLTDILSNNFTLNISPSGTFHAELPIIAILGATNLTASCSPKIIIDDPNLFANPPPAITLQDFDCLTDFSNITPTQAVAMLKRLGDWLKTYRDSEFFDLELPFTGGKRVGDWFDSGTAFVDSIYKRMIRREVVASGTQTDAFRTLGQLTADAHFMVTVGTDAPVSVTVAAASTITNSALANAAAGFNLALPTALAAKVEFQINSDGRLSLALKDGQTADVLKLEAVSASDAIVTEAGFVPMQGSTAQDSTVTQLFSTLQGFVARLNEVLAPLVITPAYDPVNKEVTMAVHFDWNYTKSTPVNLGGDLGPIASFSTTAQFNVAATLTFDFTLGFALKPKNTPQLVTTAFVPPPSDGKLHDDSSFYVIVGADAPVLVTLSAAGTNANNSLADLSTYINTRLTAAGLGSKVRALVTSANHLALAVFNEDRDGDGHLDVQEDLAEPGYPVGDGKLDRIEDLPQPGFPLGDGRLDVFEDLNGDGVLQSWEDADGDNYLDGNEDFDGNGLLGTVTEDVDGDGRLDVAEDTLIVNNTLDSLLGVQTLRIVADADDPIYTEAGFLPETARAESRGLFLDNAKVTGALNVSLTGIAASARFSIFGIQVSNGSASGSVTLDAMLRNRAGTTRRVPLNELFAAANAGALGQVLSNSTGLNTQPKFAGSLNLTLPITVSFPGFALPADAKIIIGIPDITQLKDASGQLAIHAGTDLAVPTSPAAPGIWLVYPNLDGLFHFSCLDIPTYILALDGLVQDLGQLSSFSFLNKPLPLINQSFSELIGQVGKLAQWLNDVRSDPGDTLSALETKLETALDIDPTLFTLSIDNVPNPSLAPNGTAVFNPQGGNNALKFTNSTASNITVRILDEGNIPGTDMTLDADKKATANWDGTNNTLTIEVNSGVTTAANVTLAVSTSGAPVTVAPDTTTITGDGTANDGSGVITKTALKLHFNYTLAYGIQRPFELSLADLVPLLPAGSPAVALLAGFTSFIDVEGTGKLDINASATLTIDFGLDVTNSCSPPRPFLYDTTGLTLKGRVTATDLDFKAALGPLGIFVVNGSAAFDKDGNADTADDAEFRLGLADSPSGRYYLGSGSNFFSTSSNFDLAIEAGLGVTLPLFFPAQSLPFGGSAADGNNDGYLDNYLVVEIPDLVRLFQPYKTGSTSGLATIAPVGDDNDFTIMGPVGVGIKFVHSKTAVPLPSAIYDSPQNTLVITLDHGVTTAAQVVAAINSYGNGFSATPVASATGEVKVPVLLITPDFNSLLPSIDLCTLIQSSGILLDGLDELLGKIEGGLDKVALSGNFPLVGNKLAQGANFIRGFRDGLLGDLRRKLATVGGDPINLVKQAIWNVLGQPSLDLLVHPITGDDTLTGWSDLDIQCTGSEVLFNLRLKKTIAAVDTSADPIDLDIGVPSLGLEINGSVLIQVGFDVRLNFGINKTDGFYYKTDNPFDTDYPAGGGGRPELIVNLTVTVPGLDVTGTLFFLQLNATDGHTSHIGHLPGDHGGNAPSNFTGLFTVDVIEPDLKLTFNDMRSGGFSFDETFKATISATAEVNLDLRITFGGDATFPNFAGEFDLDWAWSSASASSPTLYIAFNHLTIDAGSYISNLLVPILKKVQEVTGPIEPIAQMLITPIPGLSDLSGEDVTFLDIAEATGYLKPSTRKFIETVVKIIHIINSVGAATSAAGANALTFDLGSCTVTATWPTTAGSPATVSGPMQQSESTSAPPANNSIMSALRDVLSDLHELGFEFPILSVGEIIKLMQGKTATLVEYHMPVLYFSFTYGVSISLYPPFATLVVGGTVSATIDLTFGFDTYGLPIYKNSHDVLDLLQGLYIKDTDSNGVEVPEVVLSGGIFVGVAGGVSFGPIEVLFGVSGGVFIELEFDLNDPDADGKVRALEILANAQRDIRCIFDIHGRIYLVISVFLKVKAVVFKFEKQWDFPEITLYEFDLTCPPPILAHTNGSQLVLHMGPNAHLREEIDTNDNGETFVVQHLDGVAGSEKVLVKWNGFQTEFDNIASIMAEGGAGNDTIDASGVLSAVQFNGGPGDDTIYNSDNAASDIHGGANNDTLIGSAKVANTMFGDDGNDTITGNVFNDVFHGGAGNDTITGNGGDDRLFGEDGDDTLTTLAGNDYLDGGPGSDVLDAGENADGLYGSAGNDKLLAGRGDDWLVGGPGADTLDGGAGRDILVGDNAASITIMIGGGTAVTWNLAGTSSPATWNVSGGPGPTTWDVTGLTGEGDDLLIGGANDDALFGVGGRDTMFGGTLMASGVPTPMEQDGADFMDGGAGDDVEYSDDAFAPVGVRPSGPAVSGRVWSDTNGDGLQDNGEPGMAGVTVELYNGTTSVLEDTVTTDIVGDYSFVGLHAGDYYARFVKLAPVQDFSPKDAGSDDTLDSDPDSVTGETDAFTLATTGGKTGLDAGLRGPPILVIDDVTKTEGTMLGTTTLGITTYGTTALTFTVSLSAPSAQTVTVNYTTASGLTSSAAAGSDFTPATGTLIFTPGTSRLTIAIPVRADTVYESNEDFLVLLSNALEGLTVLAIAKPAGQGLILDDDPKPAITIDDRTVTETAGGTTAKFTLQLSNPSSETITVGWTTADAVNAMGEVTPDSAHFGADYTAASGTVTFLPGVTKLVDIITVNILDDLFDEDGVSNDVTTADGPINRAEHILVILANPVNASILDGFGNATILDDDAPPAVNIGPVHVPASVTEGDAGYHTATFTISLTAPSALVVKVTWATARGTATDLGTSDFDQPDFVNDTGAVIFTPGGPSSQTITVKVLGDTIEEGLAPEYFFVNLVRADNAAIGDNHAIVVINDTDTGADAGPWNVQFTDVKYTVQEDAGFAAITLARAAGSSHAVAVLYTQNGSATAGFDYTSTRILVRFAEDETEKTILLPILNDTLIEDTETVHLFLRNPTGGFVRGEFTTASLDILDNEPRPIVTIDDTSVAEADPIIAGGTADTQTITFTLHLSAMAEMPVNVPWSTNNRSAIGGFDYAPASGVATFGIHALTMTIIVMVKNDDAAEPVEEFVINLGMPDQATLGDQQALGTIYDDDKTPVSGRVFLDEDGDAYFDFFEHGLAGLQVMVADYANTSVPVTTDSTGAWNTTVLMGATKITVVEPGSPPGLPPGLITSTGNNPQTVTISNLVDMAGDVGYEPDLVPDVPPDTIGEGSGGLDDTVFGGGDNDILNGGGGNDFLIGGHWLLGAGCACADSAYDAHLEQAGAMLRINLAAASRNDGGTISGRVFDDVNGNNFYDGPDTLGPHPLITGVAVNLFDRDYALVASTVTDSNGNYSFSHLAGCDYSVQFVAPSGLRFVNPGVGSGLTDSDADTLSGLTPQVPIAGSATVSNVDGGVSTLPPPSNGPWALSFGSSVYNVWEPDGLAQILIERVPGSFEPLAVLFTRDGTATAGADYTALFRRLVDLSGAQNDIVHTFNIVADSVTEGLETIRLFLRNPTGGLVQGGRPEAVVLIFDLRCTDDDRITGSHGDDRMLGDHGFVENTGTVTLIGGSGKDALIGGNGYDTMHGQGGGDRLDGGIGNDGLLGGEGDDVYVFDTDTPAGIDLITELPGAANGIDTLDFSTTTAVAVNVDLAIGGTFQEVSVVNVSVGVTAIHLNLTLSDGGAIENLIGGGANDTLLGNTLDNVITGGPGSDTINGRAGIDTLVEERDVDFVLTNTSLGIIAPAETDTLTEIERVELTGGQGNNRFEVSGWTGGPVSIDGRAGTDTILSTNDASFTLTDTQLLRIPGVLFHLASIDSAILTGGAGINTLNASAFTGPATLIGAAGNDTLLGGTGDNTYPFITDTALDSDIIIDPGGTDTLDFSGTTAFGVTVDLSEPGAQFVNNNLTLTLSNGSSIENVLGSALDDTLTGNALANRITGGSGNDAMSGGAGGDIYIFDTDTALTSGAGHDTVTEAPGPANGADTLDFSGTTTQATALTVIIDLSLAATDQVVNANLKLRLSDGSVIENVIGGAFNDRITGNDLNNTFTGGAGNDTYVFGTDTQLNSDTIVDHSGTDTLDFSGTTAFGVTANLSNAGAQGVNNNLTLTLSSGSSVENVIGGAMDDKFTGNDLNNSFAGGAGDDTYMFDADSALGADTIDESGGGSDTLDFSATTTAAITINLSIPGQQTVNNPNPNLKLTLLGAGNTIENIIGGGKNDVLMGNSLANRLEGGGGDDALIGGNGDDTYVFRDNWGHDTVQELAGGGSDTLNFSQVLTAGVIFDIGATATAAQGLNNTATHAGEQIEKFIGTNGDDTFNVTRSATTAFSVDGGNGTDTLNLSGTGQPVSSPNIP
jgi:Ca2+-binding RTX toxin-like protein